MAKGLRGGKRYPYGTMYRTLLQQGNIKFIRYNLRNNAKAPEETMTKGRIYVTLDSNNEPKYITYYDKNNKRFKQIDITGIPHLIDGEYTIPHTHMGYIHDENGTRKPTLKESKMIVRVLKTWDNKNKISE